MHIYQRSGLHKVAQWRPGFVEWFFLKPNCYLHNTLLVFRKSSNFNLINFANRLWKYDRREIGKIAHLSFWKVVSLFAVLRDSGYIPLRNYWLMMCKWGNDWFSGYLKGFIYVWPLSSLIMPGTCLDKFCRKT